jgi:hypothetical protein
MNHKMQQYLPGDVMSLVVKYLDERDYARLAQVNKAWNGWAYRNSVWGIHRWKFKSGFTSPLFQTPKEGFHIGSKQKACFFRWLDNQQISLCKPVQTYYLDWKKLGSPCEYTEHHRFEDALIHPSIYTSLEKEDQYYVFHRFADYAITSTINRYAQYLKLLLQEFHEIQLNLRNSPIPFALGFTDSGIVRQMQEASHAIVKKYHEEAVGFIDYYMDRLRRSIYALRVRGQTIWDTNEATFLKDPYAIWDSIAFSWISTYRMMED